MIWYLTCGLLNVTETCKYWRKRDGDNPEQFETMVNGTDGWC